METTRGVVFVALVVLMIGGVLWVENGLVAPASIGDGVMHYAPMEPPDAPVVPGSSAKLVRTDTGVTMTIHTSDLDPGAAHTVWWFIYNNPQECADYPAGPCRFIDFDNPNVQATTIFAAGHIIGNNGVGNFAAHLAAGDASGLIDARKVQIQLGVVSHGQPIPGMVKEQISMFNGGCPPNTCVDQQYSTVFVP